MKAGRCAVPRYDFTRDELVDALTRVQTVTLVKGGAGVINAESMADALIGALTGTPVPVHYRWPVVCGDLTSGRVWTGNLDRVTCAACRAGAE